MDFRKKTPIRGDYTSSCRTVGQMHQKCKDTSSFFLLMSDSSTCLVDFMGCAGLQNTNMDLLQQSSLILVTLTSKGKFLYIFGGAGPESAVLH